MRFLSHEKAETLTEALITMVIRPTQKLTIPAPEVGGTRNIIYIYFACLSFPTIRWPCHQHHKRKDSILKFCMISLLGYPLQSTPWQSILNELSP